MKRSQITIFIILGIVVLIIFGLFYFISRQTSDVVLEKKVNKIYSDFLSSTNTKNIANDCLDRTIRDALLLVGLQGGRIYNYQIEGGYNITSFYDVVPYNYSFLRNPNGTIYNVSYGIKAPAGIPYPEPQDYPYPGSLVEDVYSLPMAYFFRNSNNQLFASVEEKEKFTILADLCNKLGSNDPYVKGAGISCETYSVKNESIQEYIKKYIEQNVEGCINFTFERTEKYNLSTGRVSINVLIGEDDLLVSFRYPIEISIKDKPPKTRYLDFNVRSKIRLKILHEIATHLIGYDPHLIKTYSDSNNIFFNMEKDDPNDCYKDRSSCVIEGINVYKLRDYCLNHNHCNLHERHYNYSDIFVIEDSKSIIDGRPYRFQFAIENRRPALDFIDESVDDDEYYYWYLNATYRRNLAQTYKAAGPVSDDYNIIIGAGNVLKIFPLGIDPDEDNLTYRYKVVNSDSGWTDNDFEGSSYYTSGVNGRKFVSGFLSDHLAEKDVHVGVGSSSGSNRIIVNVSDNEGLYDYQDIVIKVV